MVYVIKCLSLHSVIASGCVNGCAYVSSRFLWVPCVSLLISSAYVSVSMMCVSSDRRCSRPVDPDDFLQTFVATLSATGRCEELSDKTSAAPGPGGESVSGC